MEGASAADKDKARPATISPVPAETGGAGPASKKRGGGGQSLKEPRTKGGANAGASAAGKGSNSVASSAKKPEAAAGKPAPRPVQPGQCEDNSTNDFHEPDPLEAEAVAFKAANTIALLPSQIPKQSLAGLNVDYDISAVVASADKLLDLGPVKSVPLPPPSTTASAKDKARTARVIDNLHNKAARANVQAFYDPCERFAFGTISSSRYKCFCDRVAANVRMDVVGCPRCRCVDATFMSDVFPFAPFTFFYRTQSSINFKTDEDGALGHINLEESKDLMHWYEIWLAAHAEDDKDDFDMYQKNNWATLPKV